MTTKTPREFTDEFRQETVYLAFSPSRRLMRVTRSPVLALKSDCLKADIGPQERCRHAIIAIENWPRALIKLFACQRSYAAFIVVPALSDHEPSRQRHRSLANLRHRLSQE
jgi:hypothetical protein